MKLGPADFDYDVINAFVKSGQKGMLTAFKGDPATRGSELQISYYLNVGQPFKADFMMGNYTDKIVNYTIICLIDYEQREFLFDNHPAKAHFVSIKPGDRLIFPLKVTDLKKGAHDLILFAVAISADSNIMQDADNRFLFHRANVFVESYSFPKLSFKKLRHTSTDVDASILAISKSDKYDINDSIDKVTSLSKDRSYYLHVSNPNNEVSASVAVLFSDLNQAYGQFSGNDIFYHFLESKSQSSIKLLPRLTDQVKSLWAISVENPYIVLEPEPGKMTQKPTFLRISNIMKFNTQ
ncbi:MAG: hypothetical protein HY753_02735 [Nitrospirae bacterium]|nr:hypothetical protein [Nitrospirota bacterium]